MAYLYPYTISLLFFSCIPYSVSSNNAFGKSFICSHGKNTSLTYKNNINRLFSNFTSQSLISNYYTTSIGDGPNKVYGYYMCRADITPQACTNCIANTKQFALEANCEYDEGLAFSDKCIFRYANHSLYGVLDNSSTINTRSGFTSVANTELFNQTMLNIADYLIKEAAFGSNNESSNVGFATKEMNVMGKEGMKIYGLAQYTPDIIGVKCSGCLRSVFNEFQRCCNGYLPAVVFKPNCLMMYDDVKFYEFDDEKDVGDEEQGSLKPPIVEDKGRLSSVGNGLGVTSLMGVFNFMLFLVFIVY